MHPAGVTGPAGDESLRAAVLAWGEGQRRDLPWRRTRDPWAILVSELMLQQTQVARVIPRYEAFLSRFPHVRATASAGVADVVRQWEGLGYNRRAVRLHATACRVVDVHGGRFPSTLPELLALPGVGPYTARAVLAFAFEADAAVVDTNVARVLARLIGRPLQPKEVQTAADRLAPPGRSWAWNQAMLDVGALVCRARSCDCASCPLAAVCAWHVSGHPPPDPAVGSAGVSGGQSAFAGSDRQGRGRLVAVLRRGSVPLAEVAAAAGWPSDPERAHRVAGTLVADGLAVIDGPVLRLP